MIENEHYIGSELEIFKEANTWKRYFAQVIRPYLGDSVLEVGAGIGGTTDALLTPNCKRWVCLEPDRELAETLEKKLSDQRTATNYEVKTCYLSDLQQDERFDTIVYIDVLEHIEEDRAEVERAMDKLSPRGRLVVLSPAHQWLFSEFDREIGHFRRYTRRSIAALTPRNASIKELRYLDSVGMFASMANRLLLRQSMPEKKQILFWDRMMVPISRLLDPLFFHRIGKSVLVVWERDK